MSRYMIADAREIDVLRAAVATLGEGFEQLPATTPAYDWTHIASVVHAAAEQMQDNFPYSHPLYAGQMLKPPHPVARIAYQMAQWINPNNHALDGGRASSRMEREAVSQLAHMFRMDTHLGHLTSSGTLANLEALWIAGQEHPGRVIVGSADAHYTHERICGVLKLPYRALPVDLHGRLRLDSLEAALQEGDVGTIVATLGTTGFGAVDPLADILALARRYDVRVHADTAYGGYFALCDTLSAEVRRDFAALGAVDSLAIDPHKHGLQPYGCGCVLFGDPVLGRHYQHDSPYTYFSSDEMHLGEISLECSRAGAAAVALWATQHALPLVRDGAFAADLARCREAALSLATALADHPDVAAVVPPQLDIVVWQMQPTAELDASARARAVFRQAAHRDLHLALIDVANERLPGTSSDGVTTCLRSVLMKPEHAEWMPEILTRLDAACASTRD